MAEEHRCQAPEGHRLCVNNCGFFGSPATMNLCSKCYLDLRLKQQKQSSMKSTVESPLASPSAAASSSTPPSSAIGSISSPLISVVSEKSGREVEVAARREVEQSHAIATATATETATAKTLPPPQRQQQQNQPNRCSVCRKRVGLTGFKCRCGTTFCGTHRYPESHGCTFDFKSVGREEIAKANPVVKAAKLEKI